MGVSKSDFDLVHDKLEQYVVRLDLNNPPANNPPARAKKWVRKLAPHRYFSTSLSANNGSKTVCGFTAGVKVLRCVLKLKL